MKQKNIFKHKITVVIFCLVVIIFIILAFRSLARSKSVEFGQISSDKRSETSRNNTMVSIISDKVNKTNVSVYFENITDPLICVQQWQESLMSIEDAVRCIDKYIDRRNET